MRPWLRLVPAIGPDRAWIEGLRREALRESVEALTPWDEDAQRRRFDADYHPGHVSIAVDGEERVGCVSMRPRDDGLHLGLFYVLPSHQGQGIGSSILVTLLDGARSVPMPVRLTVLRGSRAASLYERNGFVCVGADRWERRYLWMPPSFTLGPS